MKKERNLMNFLAIIFFNYLLKAFHFLIAKLYKLTLRLANIQYFILTL
jgi:hypothetical protein